jgi:hypothetical protein
MRLQTIDGADGGLYNHHPFGRDLAEAAASSGVMDVLSAAGLAHGWNSGGCHAFAEGLRALLDADAPSLSPSLAVVGRDGITDHVVVRIDVEGGPLYADADGLAGGEDIAAKMAHLEQCPGCTIGPPVSVADNDDTIDYHEIGLPTRITRALERALGPVDAARVSLGWIDEPATAEVPARP